MPLELKAKTTLKKLLDMSSENFDEMYSSWDELEPKSSFSIKESKDFLAGYIFGKIEHKFISWFYAEFGRAQTDEEYLEFWNITMERIKDKFQK